MSNDLVKRLWQLDMHPESAPRQAADRIEALESRAKKAELERDARGRQLNTALYGDPHFGAQALEARIEALEAERDALRAAINRAGALACQRASHAFIIDALKEPDT